MSVPVMKYAVRFGPGILLVGLAGFVCARAGCGPFAHKKRRAPLSTAERCAHQAAAAAASVRQAQRRVRHMAHA